MSFKIILINLLHLKLLLVQLLPQQRVYKDKQDQQEDDVNKLLECPLDDLNDHLQVGEST